MRGRKSCDNTWVKKRTNVGWPENQRKSRLWAKKKAYLGKEKGIFGSYICPLKRKRAKFSCILTKLRTFMGLFNETYGRIEEK